MEGSGAGGDLPVAAPTIAAVIEGEGTREKTAAADPDLCPDFVEENALAAPTLSLSEASSWGSRAASAKPSPSSAK